MAHSYVVQNQQILPPGATGPTAAIPDPQVVITGTVDGLGVIVNTWFSVVNQPTAILYQNTVSPLMLAAWQAQQPPSNHVPPVLSWSQ